MNTNNNIDETWVEETISWLIYGIIWEFL